MAQLAARITGVVRSGGLPVPGATVTATEGSTKLTTTTDESGAYEFDKVAKGTWTIRVEMIAFRPASREVVAADSPVVADVSLDVAPPASTPAPSFARSGSQTGQRGYRNLALNQTAQVDALTEESTAAALQNGQTQPASANEAFLMNGTLDRGLQQNQPNDLFGGGRTGWDGQGPEGGFGPNGPGGPGAGPGGFGAGGPGGRFGRGGGGFGGRGGGQYARNGQRGGFNGPFGNRARRGRQGYHGMASFSLNNSVWDAKPFSLTGEEVPKPSFAQSRFSLVGGGPLMIPKLLHSSKTFLFVSYFGTRARNPYSSFGTVPTAADRAGNFSAVIDPATGQPFPSNLVPSVNPTSALLLQYIPLPNLAGTMTSRGLIDNYEYTTSLLNNTDNFGVRANHNLSQKDRFNGNFNMQRRDSNVAQLFGYSDTTSGAGITTNVGWTHNFSSTLLNNLQGSFSRNSNHTIPFFAYKTDVASQVGIEGVSSAPLNYGPPNLSFTNFSSLTDASPVRNVNQTAGVSDGLTLIRGTHSATFGGGFRRMQLNQDTDQNGRGSFTFTGIKTGFDFADFLLGTPYEASVRYGDTSTYFRANAWNAYALDDWHVRTNLTLNVGLRYEYFTPYSEKYNRIANLAFPLYFDGPPTEILPGQPGVPSGLIHADPHLFSPRFGLAWKPRPNGSTVVRAGYGLFYNGSIYAQFPALLAAQPPFAKTATLLITGDCPYFVIATAFTCPAGGLANTYAVDQHYKVGYAQTWNASIQQNLPKSFVMNLEYLGTRGAHLDTQIQPYPASASGVASFIYDESAGDSIYNALQIRLIRRMAHGVSLNALYTFSKSIDDASTIGGGTPVVAQNPFDLAAERGLSSFDQRHTLNLNYVLTSPVGGATGMLHEYRWLERALRDWTLGGAVTYGSGFPLTARVLGVQSDVTGNGAVGSARAEATGQPVETGSGFFNTAAFTLPPAGQYGNAGRNTIPGPSTLVFNLSLGRFVSFGERRRLEVRADATNFTNSVNYTSYGTVVNAPNYGTATAVGSMRALTLTTRFRF